jgi:hypothetical protein
VNVPKKELTIVPPEAPAFRIVFAICAVAPLSFQTLPPVPAELPLNVLFFTIRVGPWGPLKMPPPTFMALLPLMVLFVTVTIVPL